MKTATKVTGRQGKTYNKVVNIAEDGEITVLVDVFEYKDGFKGATGNKFYAISKEDYLSGIEDENVIEYLINSGIELTNEQKRRGFESIVDEMGEDEKADLIFEQSCSGLWGYLRKECKLDLDSAYIFEYVGGGRCFDSNYQGNVNPKLSAIIRQYESK